MAISRKQWIFSPAGDLFWLFLPAWGSIALCLFLPDSTLQAPIPVWIWALTAIGIDLTHVWSTIFRAYLNKEDRASHGKTLILAPVLAFPVLFAVGFYSELWFWRVLAYLALFHFMKQQYGFMAIYSAKFNKPVQGKILQDRWALYASMLYPMFYWHFSGNRKFNWFFDSDFFDLSVLLNGLPISVFWAVGHCLFIGFLIAWAAEDIVKNYRQQGEIPWVKILWVLTTALNWGFSIIYFNSSLAFTIANVAAHGIPYIALVFFYTRKKKEVQTSVQMNRKKTVVWAGLMFCTLLIVALSEEYLWDMWLNRNQTAFFEAIWTYPFAVLESNFWQSLALAALSLPQAVHYILDGHIWKGNKKNPFIKKVLIEGGRRVKSEE